MSESKITIKQLANDIKEIGMESYEFILSELPKYEKLSKELKKESKVLTKEEVRFIVYNYYVAQKNRTIAERQIFALAEKEKKSKLLEWLSPLHKNTELELKKALDYYTKNHPVGMWMRSITGVGPVIAAGLLAHIDITKVSSVAQIWAFAGLDPTKEWKAGEVRPHNQDLKNLCWNLGQSFVKMSNRESDYYGKIYKARKEYEQMNNENLLYKDQAEAKLKKYKIGKTTDAYSYYSIGKLPPAHIQARCTRYTVKFFLSHMFEIWYRIEYNKEPPKPYIIQIGGHIDYVEPPNRSIID